MRSSQAGVPREAAQDAIDQTLGQELSEPLVARHLARHASADEATLMVSASMPMRDLEWYAPTLEAPPSVVAMRYWNPASSSRWFHGAKAMGCENAVRKCSSGSAAGSVPVLPKKAAPYSLRNN